MEVSLVSYTPNPIKTLYTAYRVCYSPKTPREIEELISSEKITQSQMVEFVISKVEIGHTSPMRQVSFEFGISGISRALSHQLVRHNVGVAHEQQSQRYVNFTKSGIKHVTPKSIKDSGLSEEYEAGIKIVSELYSKLINAGVPPEDARFILPNAATTNLKTVISLEALQHLIDIRTCLQAQWEFRFLATKMRICVVNAIPEFSPFFGIKCQKNRLGYCNEPYNKWEVCPLSKIRPHKSIIIPEDVSVAT